MKTRIWICWLIIYFLSSCATSPEGFVVQGHVEGMDGKKIYLIADMTTRSPHYRKYDTLGVSVVENGEFAFRGSVDSVTTAMINTDGMRGGIQIFLENTGFEANMDFVRLENTLITGGKEQDVYNLFWELDKRLFIEGSKLRMERNEGVAKKSIEQVKEATRKLEMFNEKLDKDESEVIRQNPEMMVSAYRLWARLSNLSLEQLEEKAALLGQKAKNTVYGQEIDDWLRRLRATTPGAKAPDFKAMTTVGDSISLYAIKAKYKIIEFWASWCGPCRAEMPHMVEIYNEFHDKGLEILGVSLDRDLELWKEAIQKDGQSWLHCSDLGYKQSALARLYVVHSIPQTLLLDENNVIVARGLRGNELKAKLSELFP